MLRKRLFLRAANFWKTNRERSPDLHLSSMPRRGKGKRAAFLPAVKALPTSPGSSSKHICKASTESTSETVPRIGIIFSKKFLLHKPPPNRDHPECPERLSVCVDALRADPELEKQLVWLDPTPVTADSDWRKTVLDAVQAVHTFPAYLKELERLSEKGGSLDMDTYVAPGSYDIALLAAGAWVSAVERTMTTDSPTFALARPPGHHATPATGMGFCLLSNAAIAAKYALEHGAERVAVLDFDVHHGNGTEDAVKKEPRIRFVSSHQWPLYPGSGEEGNSGEDDNILNLNLASEAGFDEFMPRYEREMLPHLLKHGIPDLVIVSAGYDALEDDPLAGLSFEPSDYKVMVEKLVKVLGHERIVLGLEGGYNLGESGLSAGVCETVRGFSARPVRRSPAQPAAKTVLRTGIFFSPEFLLHKPPPNRDHPECPERLSVCVDALRADPELEKYLDWLDPTPVTLDSAWRKTVLDAVEAVHTFPDYLKELERLSEKGGSLDMDTYVAPGSYDIALLAAGAWVSAVERTMTTDSPTFALARPPGHHATPATGMGFCLLSNAAIAAKYALEHGAERVAVLDFDVHHGNGTEDAVKKEPRIRFVSSHQWPLYPGSGEEGNSGEDDNILNVNFASEAGLDEFMPRYEAEMLPHLLKGGIPDLVIVSAGYDALEDDPLAGLSFEPSDYKVMMEKLIKALGHRRIVLGLEGGYSLRENGLSAGVCETIRGIYSDNIPS